MSDASIMSGAELAATRHLIGLTRPDLSRIIGVREDTIKRWEQGKEPIPARIRGELRALLIEHDELSHSLLAADTPVLIPRTLPRDALRPAGWYLAAAARGIAADEDLSVGWS